MKLIQKRFLIGSREFEITDDAVYVRVRGLLKEQKLTVALSMLSPEPVINGSELEFLGHSKQEPMLSLLLNKPNAEIFNTFIETLQKKISGESIGINSVNEQHSESSQPEAPGWNVYDEPPEFDESDDSSKKKSFQPVSAERLEQDITMLKTYLNEDDIQPLLASLQALKAEPQNEAAFQKVMDAYNGLGFNQGAVLTYASYLKVLLSKSIW